MAHASTTSSAHMPDRPPKRRSVRLAERANQLARRLCADVEALAYPMPAYRARPQSSARLSAVALGASTTGLLLLTRVALRPEPSRLDVAATRLLQRRHIPLLTRVMTLISAPGFAPLQHVLTLGTALDFWSLGHRREALFTMLTMGAGTITGVLKLAIGRPRPDPTYMRKVLQFRDKSFPSGHCTHYASFYGYLLYLAYRCMAPSPPRNAILVTCAGLIVAVAPSRVYLGHHWSSDVLAGDLVGLTYLFALIRAYETLFVCAGTPVNP